MRFCSLGSGSAGNAALIEASQGITSTTVLVDCGFSLRELTRRLLRAGKRPEDLNAIFITHEHGDHIGCALGLAQRYRIPLWTSRGTWRALGPATENFDAALLNFARDGEALELGDLLVRPFAVPHDALEPLQLSCGDGRRRLGVLTDVGSLTHAVQAQLQGCDGLLLECNHDEALLRASAYPASLKRRILGSHGHLSNESAAELLAHCLHPGLRVLAAAHLSARNNRPELAVEALAAVVDASGPRDCGLPILVADQAQGLDWQTLD